MGRINWRNALNAVLIEGKIKARLSTGMRTVLDAKQWSYLLVLNRSERMEEDAVLIQSSSVSVIFH